jgi:trimeric autotransporter adhesin
VNALLSNTIGLNNTVSGVAALFSNTTGADNTAIGLGGAPTQHKRFPKHSHRFRALQKNTTGGTQNTAIGFGALSRNTSGFSNTAIGVNALDSSTTGAHNVALGKDAGRLITGNFNIDINNEGLATDNRTIRIGRVDQTRTFIAGITGVAVIGSPVQINSSGQLGVNVSSGRFKQNIQTMSDAGDVLLALRPVTFRYKKAIDPEGIPQFGLVAEEVEKVNPDFDHARSRRQTLHGAL